MLLELTIVIIGALFIVLLAHLIISKSIHLSKHFNLSGTFVGMTILSIGTSLPEIMTHVIGSLQIIKNPQLLPGISALVIGTNIGSDIFQQHFILGIIAIIGGVYLAKKDLFPLMGGLLGGAVLLLLVGLNGSISRLEGLLLVIIYIIYLIYLKYHANFTRTKDLKKQNHISAKKQLTKKEIASTTTILTFAFIAMAIVTNHVLKFSTVLLENLNISASFFGIIVIGVAAALPELTTALVALHKKRHQMSVGVLIGSNITNPTFALGIGAAISTYLVPKAVIIYDLPIKII